MTSIFLKHLDFFSDQKTIESAIARLLADEQYAAISPHVPIRFQLLLLKDKKGAHRHSGTAILTLPSEALTRLLLREYGGPLPHKALHIGEGRRTVSFSPSTAPVRPAIVERLNQAARNSNLDKPQDPAHTRHDYVGIQKIQFGWECRDEIFSIEWETIIGEGPSSSNIKFNDERREILIEIEWDNDQYLIAIRFPQISSISIHHSESDEAVIFFSLAIPPTFLQDKGTIKRRLSALPWSDHHLVAPYVSRALRLVCRGSEDLRRFSYQCRSSKRRTQDFVTAVERRKLFSPNAIAELSGWLRSMRWHISFQLQGLVSALAIDVREALELVPHILNMVHHFGEEYTASFLRAFRPPALDLQFSESGHNNILDFFEEQVKKYETVGSNRTNARSRGDNSFECFHVIVTPTRMRFEGPHTERSNRVVRTFNPKHHTSFLRVSFADEDEVQYRFDRDIDGKAFLNDRVRNFLLRGLTLVGRKFEFLGYSQSALKEHTVWFLRPFNLEGMRVNAQHIINGIGTFDGLAFDKTLMYCPARYGARLSQAFTATDASLSVEAEEIFTDSDIEASGWCFTDGVGRISPDLALAIHKASHKKGRRKRGSRAAAIQIRLMGSKGMLAVDYTLSHRAVVLRKSMIKFEAPHSTTIEIARAFDSPGQYFLNRPLVMLLEGLGVQYEVFKRLQDEAVSEVRKASNFLHSAARLFEHHGLGRAFRVPSILYNLDCYGKDDMNDQFYRDVLLYGTNHILRELKQRARIPVPGAWTLVGVADVHNYLEPNTIYACVQANDTPVYLQGDILISRSPTIHPGDVQIVRAIGRPPPGSPYAIEKLANTVVFSVQGSRPVPSMLGGGDLDGDEYNLLPLDKYPEFRILAQEPAEYPPAKKKLLDHPSGLEDIADFVVEYINSDVLGLVATTWLVIADMDGIFDEKCLLLADLHSRAVDYPKSGQPVEPSLIPRTSMKARPDWSAPEIIDARKASNYYRSQRAIGKLFRAIDLPVIETKRNRFRSRRNPGSGADSDNAADMLSNLNLQDDHIDELLSEIIKRFLGADGVSEESEEVVERLFTNYVYDLQSLCSDYSLSSYGHVPLTEAEVVVGTIAQQTSQPKKRKKYTSNLREQTESYLKIIRKGFEQDEDGSWEDVLERGWAAWNLSQDRLKEKEFGAASFGWIALGVIFDAIREIEQERGTRGTR